VHNERSAGARILVEGGGRKRTRVDMGGRAVSEGCVLQLRGNGNIFVTISIKLKSLRSSGCVH
jgi:hypothetical protein